MKKTFYFSHDFNARNDPKMQKVLMKLGQEGKGVFWDLIEMMYEQGGYLLLSECDSYAFALRTTCECIASLINDFGLFLKNEIKFWSESVLKRINIANEKSKKASESANSRWNKKEENTDALQSECERIENLCESNAIKESILKETKINDIKEKDIEIKENDISKETKKPVELLSGSKIIEPKKTSTTEINAEKEKLKNESKHTFSDFWNLYGKKIDIKRCEQKFKKLTNLQIEKIFKTLPAYLIYKPDSEFRKNPLTYLNNESWNDEIPLDYKNGKSNSGYKPQSQRSDEAIEKASEFFKNERSVQDESNLNVFAIFTDVKELPEPKLG